MIKEFIDNHKFVLCAGLSTFSLIFTSISVISISKSFNEVSAALEPISIWADTQNECITKTFRVNAKKTK